GEREQLNSSLFSLTHKCDKLQMESVKELSSLVEEREQLNSSLFSLTHKCDKLLMESVKRKTTCPEGWNKFENACYRHSDVANSWEHGRKDCIERGGHLVIIDSSQEQKFLSRINLLFWIGLSDLQQEGTWKWVDEAPLTLSYWEKPQPDNGNDMTAYGEEDCVQVSHSGQWNDISCDKRLPWICEKTAEAGHI
ncbi:hypothetical protein NHX12_007356, partial [Muraenolepis orangiensis]